MSKIIDITNQKFNRLTVLYRNGSSGGKAKWHCICECGNECDVIGQYLRNGHTKSCGCYQKEKTGEAARKNAKNLTNQKFNFLTALEPTNKRQGSCIVWKCLCECGTITYVASSDLILSKTKSCGCQKNSFGEIEIENILKKNNISYKKEVCFSDLKSTRNGFLRYDFAIYENDKIIRLIEFDGEQHYNKNDFNPKWHFNFDLLKENDNIKNNYAKKYNIPLVRIPYWERDKITLDMIMGDNYLVL